MKFLHYPHFENKFLKCGFIVKEIVLYGVLQFLTLIFRRFEKISVFNIETNNKAVKKQLDMQARQMLGEVIEVNLNYLVRFATIRIGCKTYAEDVVHEAVKRILEADISKVKQDSIRMYLFRIVYNLCKDFYLSDRNIRPLSDGDDEIPDHSNEDELDMEEIERLNNLLEKLPEREAEVVRMNVMDELSFVEISHILSTPASTVKSRFKSGMDKLRKQYLKN